ncbi:MAG TPA: APC family permease [Gaiellaceae bacterium]|nr:APC family permease [Gaiellaceae bacterium]
MSTSAVLARRLGTTDAVVIGLGSMVGAGVFSAFAPAAAAAGSGLLIGLALAAGVAYCNAVASAQLAVQYPTSGGTYVYGRERLGDWWGFLAGFGFVVGKTASCAAMALTFGAYVAPGSEWGRRGAALAAVAVLTTANLRGISRTARLTRVLVALSLTALAVVLAAIATSGHVELANLAGRHGGAYGILQSAGLLFFAFAGYARIATLGEEVRDPARTIPRAIPLALGLAVGVYLLVALAALSAAGPSALAASPAPVAAAVDAAAVTWSLPVVRAGAAVASLGALLALIAGIGRTALAMARNGDLPRPLASVDERRSVPARAELTVGAVVAILVATTDLRGAIGFSSFGVLVYYAIANASAYTQRPEHRRWPRALNVAGVAGCVTLAATLPAASVVAGLLVLGAGLAGRAILQVRGSTSGRPARAWGRGRRHAGTAAGCSPPPEPSSRGGRPTGSPPAS